MQSRCGRGCSSLSARRAVHDRGSRSTWGELSVRDRTRSSLTSLSRAVDIYTYISTPLSVVGGCHLGNTRGALHRGAGGEGVVRVPASERRRRRRESVVVIVVALSLSLSCYLSLFLSFSLTFSLRSSFYFFYSHPAFFRSPGFEVGVALADASDARVARETWLLGATRIRRCATRDCGIVCKSTRCD